MSLHMFLRDHYRLNNSKDMMIEKKERNPLQEGM